MHVNVHVEMRRHRSCPTSLVGMLQAWPARKCLTWKTQVSILKPALCNLSTLKKFMFGHVASSQCAGICVERVGPPEMEGHSMPFLLTSIQHFRLKRVQNTHFRLAVLAFHAPRSSAERREGTANCKLIPLMRLLPGVESVHHS